MPTSRRYHELPAGLLHFLVEGALLPADRAGAGQVEAFRLKHAWAARGEQPAVIDELRVLWTQHRAEIEQAAEDREPWIVVALRDPNTDNDEDDETETLEEE
jgi:hypothetical protein